VTPASLRPLLDAAENLFELDVFRRHGGYESARKALAMTPAEVLAEVRKAGLRGRGGAGFPAGAKWGFVRHEEGRPVYLCVNADEGEPGTFKDRWLMTHDPHTLIEGIIIAAFAVGARNAFIYIRGEYEGAARRLENAIADARGAGFLGERVFGRDFRLEVVVHRGAGSYVCGEETALMESLEGRRGEPRLKPPFPASVGLFGDPTVINNVETIANVPRVIAAGGDAFVAAGRPGDGGTRLFGVSGAVRRPGLYELPVGTPIRELVFSVAGGPPEGTVIKGVIPGGLSSPILEPEELGLPLECSALAEAGSMLGSGAVIAIGSAVSMLDVLGVMTRFYDHESCGQCTPCRIGTAWMHKIARRLAAGDGEAGDLDEIVRAASAIKGRTFCPLGDAAALPVLALVGKFRGELEERVAEAAARKAPC
jgi:NADH-quinone oxidoreductase subunit F